MEKHNTLLTGSIYSIISMGFGALSIATLFYYPEKQNI